MIKAVRGVLALLCVLISANALAATYSFGEGWFSVYNPPPCQGGSWSYVGGSTYVCTGRMVLAAGDTVIVSTAFFEPLGDITLVANGGFTLAGNTLGTNGKNISLRTDYSTITATGTNNIYGSVSAGSASVSFATGTITGSLSSSSGSITLNGTTVSGSLTSSGANNLTSATIGGAAQITNTLVASATRFNSSLNVSGDAQLTGGTVVGAAQIGGALTATGTTFSSNVTGNSSATFNGGSIAGFLNSAGDVVTTNGTTVGGAITTSYGRVNLSGGSVGGKITSPNGVTTNSTNVSGDIAASNGSVSLTGGSITGNISSGCCQITLSGITLTGNVSATSNNIVVSGSSITGNLTSTNTVSLANTSVTGDVTAATWGVTITGTGTSKVIGTCTPSLTSPADLCQAVVTPTCATDNFNRTSLGTSDWTVTNRNGSFGDPRIVNNRLRLTDNSGNVATAATFQRLLPATSNYVQVQFKYYAYNGNGADGVAVIFSDASITPQPGGYGGSLGYAQLNGTSGFAGGWLGVALDEYGNFSNPTETRVGGPGLRADSVSVRGSGSGTAGYRYLAGTGASLSPGIDVSGATAGPGHTYRITLDSTIGGKTMVTVERNTGSGFTTLIPAFDAQSQSGQTGLPSNFFMSLTGSTGGSNNIHELDDFQICATRMNPVGLQIDHIRVEHDGSALTCQPETVTVKACLDASCSSTYPDPVTVTLTPAAGWVAGNSVALTAGVGTMQYRRTTGGSVTFGIQNVNAPVKAFSVPKCANGAALSTCPLLFYESGFIFDVPNMVANTEQTVSIQAVRRDATSELCVPAFQSVTRTLKFWSSYGDPDTGTRAVSLNGNNIATASPGTDFSLAFDEQAKASFKVRYTDAGKMSLNARYAPTTGNEAGLEMVGADTFVSRPAGLCVYSDTPNSECVAGNASCSKFVAAGDLFRLRVGGVAWQDGDTDGLCSGNLKTPNYRQSDIALSHTLVAPGGGVLGNLGNGRVDIAAGDSGEKTLTDQSISEVGVFTITATPPTRYLEGPGVGNTDGSADDSREVISTSANIGRFYPASFLLADPTVNYVCNGFTYAGLVGRAGPPLQLAKAGQPFTASGSLSALNRGGSVTRNYVGGFAKLVSDSSSPGIIYTDSASLGVISGATTAISAQASQKGFFDYTTDNLAYQFNEPHAPHRLAALISATDSDGVAGNVTDKGQHPVTKLEDSTYLPEFYLGQARVGNAHGSELQNLALPFSVAYFDGNDYVPHSLDNCTVFGPAVLDAYQRADEGNGTPTLMNASPQASAGVGVYQLSAPGAKSGGSQWVRFAPAPSWLKFDWDGDGVLDNPAGLATFGIYKGAAPLIFRREMYR